MKANILTIDGGGVRGIIPAMILDYIEKEIIRLTDNPDARISDYLDFIAGTSTGSIISAMINTPGENGRPKYKMSEVSEAYMTLADEVFKKDFWRQVKMVWGLFGTKIDEKYIDRELTKILGNTKMSETLIPCAFTGYDIDKRKPTIYTNSDPSSKYAHYIVKDIVRGSTSIPVYFKPAHFIYDQDMKGNTVIDGGVFANNPSLVAYIEAGKTKQILDKYKKLTPKNTYLLSFSTGHSKLTSYKYKIVKKWGAAKWLTPILNILLQAMAAVTAYEVKMVFEASGAEKNFVRVNPIITYGDKNAADASKENMLKLKKDATDYIKANKKSLTNIAKELIKK